MAWDFRQQSVCLHCPFCPAEWPLLLENLCPFSGPAPNSPHQWEVLPFCKVQSWLLSPHSWTSCTLWHLEHCLNTKKRGGGGGEKAKSNPAWWFKLFLRLIPRPPPPPPRGSQKLPPWDPLQDPGGGGEGDSVLRTLSFQSTVILSMCFPLVYFCFVFKSYYYLWLHVGMYICIGGCCAFVYKCPRRPETSDPLELQVWMAVSHLRWVLATTPRSSENWARTTNC